MRSDHEKAQNTRTGSQEDKPVTIYAMDENRVPSRIKALYCSWIVRFYGCWIAARGLLPDTQSDIRVTCCECESLGYTY